MSPPRLCPPDDCVRTYKSLSLVAQAFRCLKGIDLRVRPIRHRVDPRVRAHWFLCLLAYSVEWHMRKALQSLVVVDEALDQDRWQRAPVKPAAACASAKANTKTPQTAAGRPVPSFATWLAHRARRRRHTHPSVSDPTGATFPPMTEPDALHAEALRLLHG